MEHQQPNEMLSPARSKYPPIPHGTTPLKKPNTNTTFEMPHLKKTQKTNYIPPNNSDASVREGSYISFSLEGSVEDISLRTVYAMQTELFIGFLYLTRSQCNSNYLFLPLSLYPEGLVRNESTYLATASLYTKPASALFTISKHRSAPSIL